ncbi:pyridoxal phosphate-dependent aminotransferase [Actinocrispum sp. NPDC049592]|uniref:pyridoxal phosphate-dependent aminotransferase n=1 Tax=Actinocrispum sp. NPDC049592 TaxID=3154835 RepID=UPI00342EC900
MDPLTVAARAAVPPFYVMDVLEAANARQRARGDVISLAAGQPSASAAAPVLEAAQKALHGNKLGYTEQLGIPELREAIAGHYERMYSLEVAPQDVVVTTGSSGGFLLSFLAAFDAGDRVALARPGYPAYRNILAALGCEIVELPCDATTRFQPTVEMLEAAGPLKGVVVASPANPTGTVLAAPELAAISGWCVENGVQLISDEIYHGIDYSGQTACSWQFGRESVVVNSFSKYFAMTGWRLGWLLVPQRLHRAVECLIGNFNICAPAIAQHAAVANFTEEAYKELDQHVDSYRTNRDLLLTGLPELGITELAPADGAFYIYADVRHLTHDTMSWCQRLLAETGLALVPGIDFDPVDGRKFIRLSFAGSRAEIEEGLHRLGGWLPA